MKYLFLQKSCNNSVFTRNWCIGLDLNILITMKPRTFNYVTDYFLSPNQNAYLQSEETTRPLNR